MTRASSFRLTTVAALVLAAFNGQACGGSSHADPSAPSSGGSAGSSGSASAGQAGSGAGGNGAAGGSVTGGDAGTSSTTGGVAGTSSGTGGSAGTGSATGGIAGTDSPGAGRDCDLRKVTCRRAPPMCDPMTVPEVSGTCYGECVPIMECACTEAADCPFPDSYTCWRSARRCGPYVS